MATKTDDKIKCFVVDPSMCQAMIFPESKADPNWDDLLEHIRLELTEGWHDEEDEILTIRVVFKTKAEIEALPEHNGC